MKAVVIYKVTSQLPSQMSVHTKEVIAFKLNTLAVDRGLTWYDPMCSKQHLSLFLKTISQHFPGGPVVKTVVFHCREHDIYSLMEEVSLAERGRKKKKKRETFYKR